MNHDLSAIANNQPSQIKYTISSNGTISGTNHWIYDYGYGHQTSPNTQSAGTYQDPRDLALQKLKIENDAYKEVIKTLSKMIAIVHADPEKLKELETAKEAYEQYLLIMKLIFGDDLEKILKTLKSM